MDKADQVAAKTEFVLDDEMLVQAMDGFLLVLSVDGDVTYVSENVTEYLGIQQVRSGLEQRCTLFPVSNCVCVTLARRST